MSRVLWAVLLGIALLDEATGADRSSGVPPKPVEVTPRGSVAGAKQPQLAVTADGAIHVAFAAGETIDLVTSTDGGASFSAPQKVGSIPGLMAGMRRGPRIVASGDVIVVSAIGSKEGDLLSWRSADQGKTWDGTTRVNSESKSAREGLHAMAIGPSGKIACIWLDLRTKKTELYCSISNDGGKTWGENRLAYHSPDGSICECCHPSAVYDSAGKLFVLWRNSLGGNRDMYLASSSDDGRTFTKGAKLGTGTWKRDSCPMDGGAVAVAAPGKASSIWRRDQEVFYTSAGESKEHRLGPGEQPTLAVNDSGTYLAWVTRRGGPLLVKPPQTTKPIELASAAFDPTLATDPTGKGPAVIVWETGRNRDTSVWFARLP